MEVSSMAVQSSLTSRRLLGPQRMQLSSLTCPFTLNIFNESVAVGILPVTCDNFTKLIKILEGYVTTKDANYLI